MEPYCCKTLLLNLAHEHQVRMTSFTTDRSSSVKSVLRSELVCCFKFTNNFFSFQWSSQRNACRLPNHHPLLRYLALYQGNKFINRLTQVKQPDHLTVFSATHTGQYLFLNNILFAVYSEGSLASSEAEVVFWWEDNIF